MSVEPIRPEDHHINGVPPLAACRRVFADRGGDIRDDALAEAIHQTFERDARLAEWRANNATAIAANKMSKWPSFTSDFEIEEKTEIDRLARLIVQGEYRRRQE